MKGGQECRASVPRLGGRGGVVGGCGGGGFGAGRGLCGLRVLGGGCWRGVVARTIICAVNMCGFTGKDGRSADWVVWSYEGLYVRLV